MYMSLSLVRIPLLLAAGIVQRIATRSPNPPPRESEKARYGIRDVICGPIVLVSTYGFQVVWWCLCAAETVHILRVCSPNGTATSRHLSSDNAFAPFYNPSPLSLTSTWLTGCALMLLGGGLRLWCFHTLGRLFTFDLTIQDAHVLVTSGPYTIVRHPSYLGSALLALGSILVLWGPGSWASASGFLQTPVGRSLAVAWMGYWTMLVIYLWGRVGTEDRVLKKQFGKEWDVYAERTRYRLVPLVY